MPCENGHFTPAKIVLMMFPVIVTFMIMKGKVNLVAYDCQKLTVGLFFLPWACCSWNLSPTSKTNYFWEYVRIPLECGFDINDASMMLRNTHMTLAPQVAKRSQDRFIEVGDCPSASCHIFTGADLGSDPTWKNTQGTQIWAIDSWRIWFNIP